MTASGRLGRKPATRSPATTPCSRSAAATRRDLRAQLGVGQRPLAAPLVPEDQRRTIVVVAEQVLGEVEPGAGEPARAELRDPAAPSGRARRPRRPRAPARPLLGDHAAEPPDLGPECLGLLDRPAVQRGEVLTPLRCRPGLVVRMCCDERGEIRALNALGVRRPERVRSDRQRGLPAPPWPPFAAHAARPHDVGGLNCACCASSQDLW